MVWTCHEERPKVYRKKDDRNGVTRKEEDQRERFLNLVIEDMGEVGAKETDVKDRKVWRKMLWLPLIEGKS